MRDDAALGKQRMIDAVQNLVRWTDASIARVYLSLFRERNALMAFLFHSLFIDEREIERKLIDPLDRTTVDQFRELIEYYLKHDYKFVSPRDVLDGLDSRGKYAMLTFDDGYYNNLRALPVLEEYKVPALFFISTNHVQRNKLFWWDVVYRERAAQGASDDQIYDESLLMKSMRTEAIEEELLNRFGPDALTPRGDTDRPFTPSELREFASSPYVHLGNHTANHAILTNYTPDEMRRQLVTAQQALRDMTGVEPVSIAYPNGGMDDTVIQACREAGLKMGFTISPRKSHLPIDESNQGLFRLGRFVPHAHASMASQCRTYRSDVLLYAMSRSIYLRLARGQST